jgi:MFS transporter, ACS family, glucarate transporter
MGELETRVTVLGPPPLERPTRVRYLVLAAACSLAVLTYVHRLAFAGVAPALLSDLDLDDTKLGYLMSAFLLAYGLFQLPSGVVGDLAGARHLLTLLVLGWSLATAAVALIFPTPAAPLLPFALLLVLRFLFGMFQAGAFPPLGRVTADWMPVPERGTAQGLIWMASRLGGALTLPLVAGLLAWWGGWRVPLVLLAGLGLVWCAWFWPWFRNTPAQMPRVNRAERALIESGRPPAVARGPVPWGRLLSARSVWGLCLMYGCGAFVSNIFVTLLPSYLQRHRHLPAGTTGWISGAPLAAGVVGCALGGLLSDALIRRTGNRKWGRRVTGMAGHTLAGACLLSTLWVEHPLLLGLLLALTMFGNDLGMGPAWAACADVGERYAGAVSGAMNGVGNLFGAVGMALAGSLLDRGEYVLLFGIFSGAYWLAALSWLLIDSTRRVAG